MPSPVLDSVDPRYAVAFPTLSVPDMALLEPFGKRQQFPAGGLVWHAGTRQLCMFLVLSGRMDIHDGRTDHHIAFHDPGEFSGDIDVLSGRPSLVRAIATTDLEVLQIPGDCVRTIVGELPAIGDIIVRAFLTRRAILLERGAAGPLVIGSRFSKETLDIREFLFKNRVPCVWEDLEENKGTDDVLKEFHLTEEDTPIVVLCAGFYLCKPSLAEVGLKLGIQHPVEAKLYDLVVIGAGPAGLAAAVYGGSEGLSTLVFDKYGPGGQAGTSSRIENYVGFPSGLSGQDLANNAVTQAERFGADIIAPAVVTGLTCTEIGGHEVTLGNGEKIVSKAVVLATGVRYRKLDLEDPGKYEGRGVYYSATNVERILCAESAVAVVGAGNSAGQAAVFLSEKAHRVFLVVRGGDLRKTMSSYLAMRIERSERITVLLNSEICALEGERGLESAAIVDRKTGASRVEAVKGVFVMIGAQPHTGWLPVSIARDAKGFILTGQQSVQEGKWKLDRPPFFLETSCPGVFAAGDARSNSVKRCASAVGEGSMAVALVHQFLAL